jgi:hypothetical protein
MQCAQMAGKIGETVTACTGHRTMQRAQMPENPEKL